MATTANPNRDSEAYALLQDVLTGDNAAWERFYRIYNPLIARWVGNTLKAYSVNHDREDREDLAAETWAAVLRDGMAFLRRYDPDRGRSVTSWMRLLAQRNTIDQLRTRTGRQRRREQGVEMDQAFAAEDTPHKRLERAEQFQLARAAVSQLKRVDQQFLSRYLEVSQVAHLASSLGCSVGAIHSRQFKIRNKLRHLIHVEQQHADLRQSAWAYAGRRHAVAS